MNDSTYNYHQSLMTLQQTNNTPNTTTSATTMSSQTDSSALQHAYVLDQAAVGFAYQQHAELRAAEKARRKAHAQHQAQLDMTTTSGTAALQHAYVLNATAFAYVDQQRQEAKEAQRAASKKALKQKRLEAEKLGEEEVDDGASVRSFASSTVGLIKEKFSRRSEKRSERRRSGELERSMANQMKMV